jgi:hypothetical protein
MPYSESAKALFLSRLSLKETSKVSLPASYKKAYRLSVLPAKK